VHFCKVRSQGSLCRENVSTQVGQFAVIERLCVITVCKLLTKSKGELSVMAAQGRKGGRRMGLSVQTSVNVTYL